MNVFEDLIAGMHAIVAVLESRGLAVPIRTDADDHGRIRGEAAFAMLSGTAPAPVCSSRTDRHRLNRLGDGQLNRALQVIAVARMRSHPPTREYVQRRLAEGKTRREIRRYIKRYLARHFYRVL